MNVFNKRETDNHSYVRCEKKSWKNSGVNGIRTHDLCDAAVVLYQLSYQANWELVILRIYKRWK